MALTNSSYQPTGNLKSAELVTYQRSVIVEAEYPPQMKQCQFGTPLKNFVWGVRKEWG